MDIGHVPKQSGKEKTLQDVEEICDLYRKHNLPRMSHEFAKILEMRAALLKDLENPEEALKYHRKFLKIVKELSEPGDWEITMGLKAIARDHSAMKNYELSVQTYKKILERYEMYHDKQPLTGTKLKEKLNVYFYLSKELIFGCERFQEAIEICQKFLDLHNEYHKAFW